MTLDHAGAVDALPMRPRLADGAAVHAPADDGGPWLLETPGGRYLRVGADLARLAQVLTGEHDRDELLALLGERWNDEALDQALRSLQGMRLLDDGRQRRVSSRRVTLAPPFTLQLSLLNPTGLLRAMSPLIEVLGRRGALMGIAAVSLAGLPALALEAGHLRDAISNPITGSTLLFFMVAIFVSTAIHELAHGAVLVRYGAEPRRMGVMLFYLVPAFFCDVSDGWRLPRNQQRVRVALAGIVAQLACAGLLALAALPAAGTGAHQWLLLASASLYIAGLVNLVPFVKLDGYLALMAHLDISNLRDQAMADARSFLGSVLFGARRTRSLPQLRWAVPYGLACMAFPLYLIGVVAFALWSQNMADIGFMGALLTLLLGLTLVLMVVVGLRRLILDALGSGAPVARLVGVLALGAALLGVVGTQVHLEQKLRGTYVVDGDRTVLLVPENAAADLVRPGQQVELRTKGVILQPVTGTAVVGAEVTDAVPDGPLLPIDLGFDLELPVVHRAFELDRTDGDGATSGTTRVQVGERPLWRWLMTKYVDPVL